MAPSAVAPSAGGAPGARDPAARAAAVFDAAWYLARNPDVAAAGVDPWRHYLSDGHAQDRDPHPLFAEHWYWVQLDGRPDGVPGLVHYLAEGAAAGADPGPLLSAALYARQFPWVRPGRTSPLEHYLQVAGHVADPNAYFSAYWYRSQLGPGDDVSAVPLLLHYLAVGEARGLVPGPWFDPAAYLAAGPDVAAAGVSPLRHLLEAGLAEGRRPRAVRAGLSGALDQPRGGTAAGPVGDVWGWADPGGGLRGVEVVGAGPPLLARPGMPRADVAAAYGRPGLALAGWSATLPVEAVVHPRPLVLAADALLAGGGRLPAGGRLRLGSAAVVPAPASARDAGAAGGGAQDAGAGGAPGGRAGGDAAARQRWRRFARPPGGGVAVFTHQLDLGGGQLYLQEVLRGLRGATRGRVGVVAFKGGPLADELEDAGVDVHVVGWPQTRTPEDYERTLALWAALVADVAPSVALVNTVLQFPGADLATRAGLPTAWFVHESYPLPRLRQLLEAPQGLGDYAYARLRHALGAADRVVFEADHTRGLVTAGLDCRAEVLRYGVEVPARPADDRVRAAAAARRRALGFGDDDPVFLSVGSYEPRKAQGLMVAAWREVVRRHPRARLVLVGRRAGDGFGDALAAAAAADGLDASVALVPGTPDLDPWYEAADFYLCASDVESMPRTLLEAMARERVCLATAVHGIPELVADGRSGLLFAPNDLDALAGAVDAALAMDPARRAAVAAAARETVARDFDVRGYVGDVVAWVQERTGERTG